MKLRHKITIALGGLVFALVGVLAAASSASAALPGPDTGVWTPTQTSSTTSFTLHEGSPAWVFIVVALGAVLLTLIVEALAMRMPAARKRILHT